MPVLPLMLGAWYVTLFTLMFVGVCLFLILVVLIQKPRGSGLTGAFGGAGGGAGSVFGSKTGDVLTWVTVVCFALFIGLSMLLTWTAKPGQTTIAPILNTGTGDTNPSGPDTSILDALSGKDSKSGTQPAPAPAPAPGPTPPAPSPTDGKINPTPAPEPKTPETPKTDGK